jgi:protein-disulfide isomerase
MMARLDLTGEPISALGNPRAPLTVVEFSDYGCPFCRRYVSSAFPQIKAAYIDTGKVYYVFKDLPIVQAHPQAALAAEAARCAGDQSKYWEMHAALFAAPSEWDTTAATAASAFAGYARQIGLDPAAFGACMAERRYQASVAANVAQGRHLGLTGTPSFIIDGKLLAGEYPFSVFQTAFDHELEMIAGSR